VRSRKDSLTNRFRFLAQRTEGTAQVEYAVVLMVVVGFAAVLFEAFALTPIHHRIVEAMNQELTDIAANNESSDLVAEQLPHVLTEYEIEASDATFFWQAIAGGLFALVLLKALYYCWHLRKLRHAKAVVVKKHEKLDSRQVVFEKRQRLYKIVSGHLEYLLTDRLRVDDLMCAKVKSVSSGETIQKVRDVMEENELHHLLVVDSANQLEGVISVGDVEQGDSPRVKDIMTSRPFFVQKGTGLIPAITLMLERRIACLPVLSGDQVVGVLTRTDVLILLQSILQVFSQSDIGRRFNEMLKESGEFEKVALNC